MIGQSSELHVGVTALANAQCGRGVPVGSVGRYTHRGRGAALANACCARGANTYEGRPVVAGRGKQRPYDELGAARLRADRHRAEALVRCQTPC